jgi:predicted transcriptional regulator
MSKYSPDRDVAGRLTAKKNVRRVVQKLAELSLRRAQSDEAVPGAKAGQFSDSEELIEWLVDERRTRAMHFPPGLVSGPPWDMLLELLKAHIQGRPLSVSSLCSAAALPVTTADRWADALEEWGLVVRRCDQDVPAGNAIELTSGARKTFQAYLDELSGRS